MYKRAITAIVWLLVAAIPLQGVAAAVMTHCGARHHSGAGAMQVGHALHEHAAAAQGDALSHVADPSSVSDVDDSGFPHDDGYAKCSACAACCLGAALVSSFTAPPPVLPSVAANCGVFASALEVVSTGPERPPRILLV